MGGGNTVAVLLIVLALLAFGLLIRNTLGLFAVMRLLSDCKAGRLIKVKAVVKRSVPSRRRGSARAYADYTIGERKIKGRMVGASGERLAEGQTIKVLVSERSPGIFAVDERQIKGAITAYAVMCFVFLIIAAFLFFVAVTEIVPV